MKNKLLKVFVLTFICGYIFTYIIFSFAKLDINFANWTEDFRLFYCLISSLISIVISFIITFIYSLGDI